MTGASSAVVIVQKLLEQILQLCFLNTNTQRAQSARAAITQTLKKLSLNRPGIRAQESGLFVPGPGNGLAQALHYLNFGGEVSRGNSHSSKDTDPSLAGSPMP